MDSSGLDIRILEHISLTVSFVTDCHCIRVIVFADTRFLEKWKLMPASGNEQQTKTPVKKSLSFETRQDEYGATLLCFTEDGGDTCYRREED